jgi:hypothetical protein
MKIFQVAGLQPALYKHFPEITLFHTMRYVSKQLIHYYKKRRDLEKKKPATLLPLVIFLRKFNLVTGYTSKFYLACTTHHVKIAQTDTNRRF